MSLHTLHFGRHFKPSTVFAQRPCRAACASSSECAPSSTRLPALGPRGTNCVRCAVRTAGAATERVAAPEAEPLFTAGAATETLAAPEAEPFFVGNCSGAASESRFFFAGLAVALSEKDPFRLARNAAVVLAGAGVATCLALELLALAPKASHRTLIGYAGKPSETQAPPQRGTPPSTPVFG